MTPGMQTAGLSPLDRPNSYIGKAVPRPNLERLLEGRGQYVSDITLPRMVHAVFVRSPHAHAKIVGIDVTEAKTMSGVIAVVSGRLSVGVAWQYVTPSSSTASGSSRPHS